MTGLFSSLLLLAGTGALDHKFVQNYLEKSNTKYDTDCVKETGAVRELNSSGRDQSQ